MTNRCVIYKRISDRESAEEGLALERQEARCVEYIKSTGGRLVEVYSDPAYKRHDTKRPAFLRMKADVPAGKFDTIVILKLDRLALPPAAALQFFDYAEGHGVNIYSVSEPELSGEGVGKLLRGILIQFSAFEVERIGERIRDMMEYKKKKGEFTGGNKVAVGLVYNKETKKLEPDPVKKWIVLEAYQKKFEGETFADIGRGLNAKGARTRHGNPFTCAAVRYIFKSTQYVAAGLVSESDFIKASQYMSTRGSHRERAGREPALLRGLVYCECGTRTMSRSRSDNKRGKVYTFYECQKWAHHSKAGLCNGSRKMISAIKADYVIGNVVSEFFEEGKDKLIKKYKSFIDKLGNTADVKKLRAQLRQTEKAEHRLLTAYEGDAITLAQLKERNTANADQRQQLQTQLRILEENQSPPVAEFSQILDMFADFNNIEFAKQQACVNLLIQKITMHKESLEVTYRFAPPQTYPIPYMKQTRHIRH